MPITVAWDNEAHTAIYTNFDGKWAWDDYYPITQEMTRMMDGVDHSVDIIAHLQSAHFPGRAITQLGPASAYLRHPRTGQVVVVGAHTFVRMLVDTFSRIYSDRARKFFFASSLEEARALLVRQRSQQNRAG